MGIYDLRVVLSDRQALDFVGVPIEVLPWGVRIDEDGVGFVIPAHRVESVEIRAHVVAREVPFSALKGD